MLVASNQQKVFNSKIYEPDTIKEANMGKTFKPEDLLYESPIVDVVEFITLDVIRTSEPISGSEGGAETPGDWFN